MVTLRTYRRGGWEVDIRLRLPDGFPPERRQALLAVAGKCTVHNSLVDPPRVNLTVEAHSAAA